MDSLTFKTNISNRRLLEPRYNLAASIKSKDRNTLVVQDEVKIRFSRFGRKKRPFYRIVAVDSRKPRETKVLEYLGWHDPIKKETNLNAPAIKKWISHGAQPSETVGHLLKKAMVIEKK